MQLKIFIVFVLQLIMIRMICANPNCNLTAVNNTNVGCSGDIIQLNCTHSYNKTVAISWMKNGTHINKAPLGDEGETFSLLNVTLKGNVSGQSTFLYSCNLHHIDTNENEACNDILVIVNFCNSSIPDDHSNSSSKTSDLFCAKLLTLLSLILIIC